jgi:hypothetical protein
MATVHVGANADPHPSIILVPTEGRRASSTLLRSHPSCQMTTRGGRHSHWLGSALQSQNIVPTRLLDQLRDRARVLKRDTFALYLAARDPRTPWHAKLVAAAVVA